MMTRCPNLSMSQANFTSCATLPRKSWLRSKGITTWCSTQRKLKNPLRISSWAQQGKSNSFQWKWHRPCWRRTIMKPWTLHFITPSLTACLRSIAQNYEQLCDFNKIVLLIPFLAFSHPISVLPHLLGQGDLSFCTSLIILTIDNHSDHPKKHGLQFNKADFSILKPIKISKASF